MDHISNLHEMVPLRAAVALNNYNGICEGTDVLLAHLAVLCVSSGFSSQGSVEREASDTGD